MIKSILAAAAVFLAQASWAGGARDLSGPEVQALFAGAAMYGDFPDDGSTWAERTTRSGRVLDLLKGGKHVGSWTVTGDEICYVYFGRPPLRPCYQIQRSGGEVHFIDPSNGALLARATRVVPPKRRAY